MTDEQLDALAALEQAATTGPWLQDLNRPHTVLCTDDEFIGSVLYNVNENDVPFVVAARNAFRDLIAQAREANELRAQLVKAYQLIERITPQADQVVGVEDEILREAYLILKGAQ